MISLDAHRRRQQSAVRPPAMAIAEPVAVEFAFDLRSAWTYLAAERVERCFANVRWTPVLADRPADAADRLEVEARAAAMQMPLVWPDRAAVAGIGAMRIAAWAASHGCAARFVMAAVRLAYCGGFDLDDPEILAEAAAAACLPLEPCLRAFGDRRLDDAMRAGAAAVGAAGADELPALRVGGRWFAGEHRLAEAAAASRGMAVRPLINPAS